MYPKNTWTKVLTVGAILWAAGAALGQTPAVDSPSRGVRLGIGGFDSTTPEEQAAFDIQCQLERAAAKELDAGQFAQAEADARQALATCKTDSGMGWEVLAGALDAQGRDREALQVYGHMAARGYNPPRVWLPYALLLLKAGQWAQAVSAYNQALPDVTSGGDLVRASSPLPPNVPLPRVGDLLRLSNHFSPDMPEPRALATTIHIALALTQIGVDSWGGHDQKDKALAHLQAALTLSPDSDVANYYYAYGLQKLGRTQQARAAFQKTVRMAKGEVKAAAERALSEQKKPA
jgi:tetratricopeptide (TPR) repeat protein